MWPSLLILGAMMVFVVPLVPALCEWRRKTDVAPLGIVPTHDGNVRHFAQSFRRFIEKKGAALRTGAIGDEAPQYAFVSECARRSGAGVFRPVFSELLARSTSRTILSDVSLSLPDDFVFLGEIYGRRDVQGGVGDRFRSVLALGDLAIERGSRVTRWAHAATVHVAPDCEILGRLSAVRRIMLSPHCSFRRINAPRIEFGLASGPRPPAYTARPVPGREGTSLDPRSQRRRVVEGDVDFGRRARFNGDLVVRGNAVIRPDAEIAGSIKAHGAVALEPGARVRRSVVARESVIVGHRCAVGGPIVSERSVVIGAESIVGSEEAPTTITAPVIRICAGVVVHGTVWARERGETVERPT